MMFGQVMAKIRHGGGSFMVAFWPFGRLLVWFVWSDKRVNCTNSYSRQTTKINSIV
jgi:hypothetical protein